MSKFNKDMTIGEVLRIDMNAASVPDGNRYALPWLSCFSG